jgi:hypothetical protein
MRILYILSLSVVFVTGVLGQEKDFETKYFSGHITVTPVDDTTVTYSLTLLNHSVKDVFLLKTWTSFQPIQTNNPGTIYFDFTFPSSGDIYSCRSCEFQLYKVKPNEKTSFKVTKLGMRQVSEAIVMFDQILLDDIKDKRMKNRLLETDRKGIPKLSFKYYFDSGGTPMNGETIRLSL